MDELDELRLKIAKVKGIDYRVSDGSSRDYLQNEREYARVGELIMTVDTGADYEEFYLPDWPREWNAAGELWSEMVAAGRNPSLLCFPDENDNGRITHVVLLVNAYQECPFGETGPEAIARAYLAWKEASHD